MSDAHSHAHGGPDHVPHVTPLPTYLKTFGALMVLTVITVGASYVDLGTSVNLAIAIFIATIKATVVATFFMHLLHDSKFNAMALISSVVFLGIFVGFTMLDTTARGQYDKEQKERVPNVADPFAAPTAVVPKAASGAPAAAPARPSASASASAVVSALPSAAPSAAVSADPSAVVSAAPSSAPTVAPSAAASVKPSAAPAAGSAKPN